jgi:hypothetical protein
VSRGDAAEFGYQMFLCGMVVGASMPAWIQGRWFAGIFLAVVGAVCGLHASLLWRRWSRKVASST